MFRSLDRTAQSSEQNSQRRAAKLFGALLAVGMLATLAGCAEPVPPPIVPPPVYAEQPYPYPYAYAAPAPRPYYYAPYASPYPYSYYGPCCSSLSFGFSSGFHRGGRFHHWHR